MCWEVAWSLLVAMSEAWPAMRCEGILKDGVERPIRAAAAGMFCILEARNAISYRGSGVLGKATAAGGYCGADSGAIYST
jgi:hypothetical protein